MVLASAGRKTGSAVSRVAAAHVSSRRIPRQGAFEPENLLVPLAAPSKTASVEDHKARRQIDVVVFDRFELLDVFGPLELYGALPDAFGIRLIGPAYGPVRSAQGPQVVADFGYPDAPAPDVVLVPGGIGTRILVEDQYFRDWLGAWAAGANLVTSVCTGAALLAAAGLLDGYRATSNKRSFDWVVSQGPRVEWIAKARWVQDRDRWSSSGVAAGMDMTLAVIADIHGDHVARGLADAVEYEWHHDPDWDPFSDRWGAMA